MPEEIEKAVFTTVEALCGWCKPVYVRERLDNAVLTSEEVLGVKHVDACVSCRAYRESSFHRSGGPLRFVQSCLCAVKT